MKKVLIISYYWPPNSGSGVQRWLKFSKYLPSFGWEPIIITPLNPYSELSDSSLKDSIPVNLEVCRYPIWEPYSLKDRLFGKKSKSQNSGLISKEKTFQNNFFNWIRGNLFIPDPKIFWVKPTVKLLLEKIKDENISHIISTGPPHSMHLIALELKKNNNNLKWIADFRDPWSNLDLLNDFNLTHSSRNKHLKLEREVLKLADVTITVSESWVNDFKLLGSKNVKLITNGYDHEDFIDFKSNIIDAFIIGHYGLLNHLRNPSNLWKVLSDLCSKNLDFNNKLEIHLSGNIDQSIIDEINSFDNLKSKLKLLGYLDHKDVIKEYSKASILLLLLFNSLSGQGNYPGKIFEYLACDKPIIAFGPKESDAKKLLENFNGTYYSYDHFSSDLEVSILSCFKNEYLIKKADKNKFTRKSLTSDLINVLNNL